MRTKGLFLMILAFGLMLAGCAGRQLTTSPKAESNGDNIGQSAGTTATQSSAGSTTQQVNATAPNKPGHVNIKELDIVLDEIPINSAYKIPQSKLKRNELRESGYDEQWVYASDNKTQVALVTNQYIKNKSDSSYNDQGVLEVFDSNGKINWSTTQKGYLPTLVELSDNNNYTHAIWASIAGDSTSEKLISYDERGKEIQVIDNIDGAAFNTQRNIIYYQTKQNPKTLFSRNFQTDEHWEKSFIITKDLFFVISESGNRIICYVDDGFCCLNQHGEILWQKKFPTLSGVFLSSDGEFFLRIIGKNKIEIYNTTSLDLISKTDFNNTINGAFIVNNSIIAIKTNEAPAICYINFYNLKGILLDKVQVKCGKIYINSISKTSYDIYIDGLKAMEYNVKW